MLTTIEKVDDIQQTLARTAVHNERILLQQLQQWMTFTIRQIRSSLYNKYIKKSITSELTDWEYIEEQGREILKPATLSIMQSGGQKANQLFQVQGAFDVLNPHSVVAAEKFTADLVRGVTKDTKAAIREHIAEGIKAGKGMPKLARELRPLVGLTPSQVSSIKNQRRLLKEKHPDWTPKQIDYHNKRYASKTHTRRLNSIARTETARAQNIGYVDSLEESGVSQAQFSKSPGACPVCDAKHGNRYLLEEARGIIPVHPNCRCAMLPVLKSKGKKPVTVATVMQAKEALPGHIEGLLEALKITTDPGEGRKIRGALRKLGHRGGLGGKPVVKKPPVVKPPAIAPKPKLKPAPELSSFREQQKVWLESLTESQKKAIEDYTSYGWKTMIPLQRSVLSGKIKLNSLRGLPARRMKEIAQIEKLLDIAPVYDKAIYRGMGFRSESVKGWQALRTKLESGKTFSFDSVQSFSASKQIASEFMGGSPGKPNNVKVLFRMKKAPKRSAMIPEQLSAVEGEREILVGADSKYRTVSVKRGPQYGTSRSYIYELEEIVDDIPVKLPLKKPGVLKTSHYDKVDGWEDRLAVHKEALRERMGFNFKDVSSLSETSPEAQAAAKKLQAAMRSFTEPKTNLNEIRASYQRDAYDALGKKVLKSIDEYYDMLEDIGGDDVLKFYSENRISFYVHEANTRAYSDWARFTVDVATNSKQRTMFHEFGHLTEANKATRLKALAWSKGRSKDGKLMPYKKIVPWTMDVQKKAFKDKFIDTYVGVVSERGGTEVMSMGLQAFRDPITMLKFAKKDFDHFAFIHGILTGAI